MKNLVKLLIILPDNDSILKIFLHFHQSSTFLPKQKNTIYFILLNFYYAYLIDFPVHKSHIAR